MARHISLKPSPHQDLRQATRLLSMVHELHKAGYQRIRIVCGMSPSGMHWRCMVTHTGAVTSDSLFLADDVRDGEVAYHSSGNGDQYFGWDDAPGRSARELAVLFLKRFPAIAREGDGRDWTYAGWLTDVLGRAELGEPGSIPVFFADYPLELDRDWLPPPVPDRP